MPPNFTRLLAERLNSISKIEVREASDGDVVRAKLALVAQGGRNLIFEKNGGDKIVRIVDFPDTLYKPSVDLMMSSASDVFGEKVLGVIMTGMGKDGLEGLRKVKEKGGYVIAQDEETSVVWGMPKAVVDAGLADSVLPLEKIGEAISRVVLKTGD
jgi:two-component system chemotaxis response regulator CheB